MSLLTTPTLVLTDYVVGSGARTEPAQLDNTGSVFTTGANTSTTCQYTATCGIWDESTQKYVSPASWSKGGITCDSTGIFTINIPDTNTDYNPSFVVKFQVIYEIVDSKVDLDLSPTRRVISQFSVTVLNKSNSCVVTHGAFPDINYIVGSASTTKNYTPGFSLGASTLTTCPQTVSL